MDLSATGPGPVRRDLGNVRVGIEYPFSIPAIRNLRVLSLTRQHSASVSVSPQPPPAITLTMLWTDRCGKALHHTLVAGSDRQLVDPYRNGNLVNATPNDGRHTTAHRFQGTATWRVRVCQAGSTTVCSPERSITLSN
jgi:hypothetical protein